MTGLWVFCGQWALDKIQIIDLSSSSPTTSPASSPFSSLPSRTSPMPPNNNSMLRGSGDIRLPTSLGSGSSPNIISSPSFKSIDDTSYTSSPSLSPTSTPASTPFSSPLSSTSSPSPSITSEPRRNLTGNGAKNTPHIPIINLTPPASPASLTRRHSNTEPDRKADGLRSLAMQHIKEKRSSQEILDKDSPFNKRVEHKRSLSEGGGEEFMGPDEGGKSSSDTEGKSNNLDSSINLVRSQSVEHQKLLAGLPDNGIYFYLLVGLCFPSY